MRQVKSTRKCTTSKSHKKSCSSYPIDFQQTNIEGVNLKNVPADVIVTRKVEDLPYIDSSKHHKSRHTDDNKRSPSNVTSHTNVSAEESESDPEIEAYIAKKWGTPQLNFNRKYLKSSVSNDSSSSSGSSNQSSEKDECRKGHKCRFVNDVSQVGVAATSRSSYKMRTKNMKSSLRKSFKNLKTDIIEMKPFGRKSPEKSLIK